MKKLDLLLGACDNRADIQLFIGEFKALNDASAKVKEDLSLKLQEAEKNLKALKETAFSWRTISDQAQRVQEVMLDKEPVVLKNAYRSLFKSIVVSGEDEMGNRSVTYVLTDSESSEDVVRFSPNLVEVFLIKFS